MKTLLVVWALYNGQIVPNSLMMAEYPSMEACQQKGLEVKAAFDGKKTLLTADFRCSVIGVKT